ncbi:putative WRKY transcription factor 11 [Zea mays]|uniref:Putative WRKY transcription factor 11 n=1 Tax=Zea mays TaxID=4577 RepID=A0A3L6EIL9_MAIZE|nr:putative WRKY transcription factor 11 [Zea mays]
MITVDDDQVRSCGGDSGGVPVPSGDDDAAGRQILTTMGEHHQQQLTMSRIRTAVSMLTRRTGHARFRRGPVAERHHASSSDHHQLRPPAAGGGVALDLDLLVAKTCDDAAAGFSASASWTSSSMPSTTSLTAGEGSVSKGRAQQQGCGALFFVQPVSGGGGDGHSAGKPLRLAPSSMQQQHASPGYSSPGNALEDGKCHDRARSENDAAAAAGKTHGDRCHCSNKRKSRVKRVVRVPAISSRNADIPPDDYSWRKYGQKPIKGSPYPRGYYKCSTVRGCPARKHVERDPGEPAMLIVTYEGDHRHEDRPAGGVAQTDQDRTTTSS